MLINEDIYYYFSLIYNKPFITILLNKGYERMNTRVLELLKCANLTNRIYDGDLMKFTESVNFSSFNGYRLMEEQQSSSYLSIYIK